MQSSGVQVEPPLHTKHGEVVRRGCEASHHGGSAAEAHTARTVHSREIYFS